MWKRLTVHSVLRYLFVGQWCTLRSAVAAKQPSVTDDSCFMLQLKTLTSALFSYYIFPKLRQLLCYHHFLAAHQSQSWNLEKINMITQPLTRAPSSVLELSWENHAKIKTLDCVIFSSNHDCNYWLSSAVCSYLFLDKVRSSKFPQKWLMVKNQFYILILRFIAWFIILYNRHTVQPKVSC